MTKTDTPRTDAQQREDQKNIWGKPTGYSMSKVSIDFARQLERELAEWKQVAERLAPLLRERANSSDWADRRNDALAAYEALKRKEVPNG